jgi:predicted SAM-dependent methyltransferase
MLNLSARAPFRQLRRRRTLRRLLATDKLHLGCGSVHYPGWANLDFSGPPGTIHWDLTLPIPARLGSIKFIYSEHFFEHISREQASRLLSHCFALLSPGGVIRISTPDLAYLIDQYIAGRVDEWVDMEWRPQTPAQMINEGLNLWGHQFVYDAEELISALRTAGFEPIILTKWGMSNHPDLAGRETRPYHHDLIVEGTKP